MTTGGGRGRGQGMFADTWGREIQNEDETEMRLPGTAGTPGTSGPEAFAGKRIHWNFSFCVYTIWRLEWLWSKLLAIHPKYLYFLVPVLHPHILFPGIVVSLLEIAGTLDAQHDSNSGLCHCYRPHSNYFASIRLSCPIYENGNLQATILSCLLQG